METLNVSYEVSDILRPKSDIVANTAAVPEVVVMGLLDSKQAIQPEHYLILL